MKKLNVLTRMLLLVALLVGSTSSVWADDTYSRITSTKDLVVGEKYIIVSEHNNVAMGTISNDKGQGISVTISSNSVTLPPTSNVNVLTLGGDSEGYTLLGSKDSKYIGYNSGTKLTSNASASTNSYKWTISFNNNDAHIANVATNTRLIRGYDNNKDFRAYTTENGSNIQLYKKVTAVGPVDPSVTIDKTTIGVGGTATISGPNGLSISYSGYDDKVVSVSDAGVVTGLSVGSTTITATWAAVAGTYNAGFKNIEINVVNSTIYEKVTNANQLVAGNKYILVATENNKAMGAQSKSIRNSVDVSISDDKVAITDQEVAVLTLGGETGAWTFLASDNDNYLALTANSNAIHASDDASLATSQWTITDDYQLKSTAQDDVRYLRYNSGSPRFACYSSGQQTAVLFVKAGSDVSTTVSIASACTDGEKYYGTYSNDKAFRVPADVTVSTIGIDNKGKLVVKNYSTGEVVKANTGVMISSETAGAHTLILTESDGTEKEGNLLKASGDAGIDDEAMAAASASGTKFYRLTMHNGTDLGFYWGAENGAAFALAANKAYLAVPAGSAPSAKEGFSFISGEEETDGIRSIENGKLRIENSDYYNLAGQRVGKDYKGIVIVNGKKMLNK